MATELAHSGWLINKDAAAKDDFYRCQSLDLTGLGEALEPASRQELLATLGTQATSQWISPLISSVALGQFSPLRRDPLHIDPNVIEIEEIPTGRVIKIIQRVLELQPELVAALPRGAVVAREVRDRSGLSAEKLGELFPVTRETYQRWISGAVTPSRENFERLLALDHFFRAAADRVTGVSEWLLAPIDGTEGETPFALLSRGDMRSLWSALATMPSWAHRVTVRDAEGNVGTSIVGALRANDAATPEDELDDYADWLDDED